MNAYVNGNKCIIYGFEKEGIFTFVDCYFPDLGYRMPVVSSDIYIC
jgi:hypothetical protein